jgi:hypothetical protein
MNEGVKQPQNAASAGACSVTSTALGIALAKQLRAPARVEGLSAIP